MANKWTYYNDNDPFICEWVRELIKDGLVPDGEVDSRSITDVSANDVRGFGQCHFFCGILGWPLAFKLAGWPRDQSVWTGSCPCQPFSAAGKQQALSDERDLWPPFFQLIAECRPPIIFGEQVEAAIRWGWLDRICDDLGGEGYTVRAEVWPACSVGAPHIRNRLFWMALAEHAERRTLNLDGADGRNGANSGRSQAHGEFGACSEVRRLAESEPQLNGSGRSGERRRAESANGGASGGLGNADAAGLQGRHQSGHGTDQFTPWAASRVIQCLDGKLRRIPLEPALFPLVDGVSRNRVGILRGAGNAIVPQVAAKFIKTVMDTLNERD